MNFVKVKDEKLKCALVFLGPFPIGNVSSIRILSYCKALVEKGCYVKVLLIAPTTEASCNRYTSGIIDGVHYEYMTRVTWKNINTPFFVKIFYYIIGLFKSVHILIKEDINCLLSYHDMFISNVFYFCISRFLRIPFVLDKTEYPENYFDKSWLNKKVINFSLGLYDGIITITEELKSFYSKITKTMYNDVFLLPMTMDLDRYRGIKKQMVKKKYIAVVFGTHNRDGLFESVVTYNMYRKLLKDDEPYNLLLIGDFEVLCETFPECKQIILYIEKEVIQEYVIFTGLVPINDVPQLLVDAECLLTTPLKFVSGGFPTKLGEYLLSGVPVVATAVGEIEKYLIDGVHILLSDPNNLEGIANNLLSVHQKKENYYEMGKSAIEVVKKYFNANVYSYDLIDYLNKFKKKKC
jgi:glycosyltransferase involved in cell wall biosynthesis